MNKNKTEKINNSIYTRNCPSCKNIILYSLPSNFYRARKNNNLCKSCSNKKFPSEESRHKMSINKLGDKNPKYWKGKKRYFSVETISKMSLTATKRYENEDERNKLSKITKQAMHRPDVRKRHIEALRQSKWLKVKTDKGQLELLDKWNRLGFNFQPNYQLHTDTELFYIDGYDPIHNVVLEYDSKYHHKHSQKIKDEDRQNKIINILHPNRFWRYNAINKTWRGI